MANREKWYAYIIAAFMVLLALANSIIIPLFLDSLLPITAPLVNTTGVNFTGAGNISFLPAIPVWQKIDPLVQIAVGMAMDTVILGIALIVIYVCYPSKITSREKSYPKRYLVFVGLTQSASALMYQFSSPGTRTAPYIQAFLRNFSIPIVFVIRFLVLRKRPTLRKALCALVIMVAGIVALIPTFVPSLETEKDHEREGGASGPWRIIWPMILVGSSIPFAISSVILERTVKYKQGKAPADCSKSTNSSTMSQLPTQYGSINTHPNEQIRSTEVGESQTPHPQPEGNDLQQNANSSECSREHLPEDKQRLNIVYTLFWTFGSTFLGVVGMFWVDFIPGFGMQQDVNQFLPQVAFNLKCIFGLTDVCGAVTISLAWGRNIFRTAGFILRALLLRYSEGSNFYSLLSSTSTPIRFLFWALFQEHPFRWQPQIELSLWLSMGAILVMLPAVIIYETGAPEISLPKKTTTSTLVVDAARGEENTPLIRNNTETT